jgi:hypothetical protein
LVGGGSRSLIVELVYVWAMWLVEDGVDGRDSEKRGVRGEREGVASLNRTTKLAADTIRPSGGDYRRDECIGHTGQEKSPSERQQVIHASLFGAVELGAAPNAAHVLQRHLIPP